MAEPPAVSLQLPEDAESDGQDLSPCNEGAMHTSFRELIQEQSSLVEAEAVMELEMQARGREPPAPWATGWPEPELGEEHAAYSSATLRVLASMPSRTIGRSRGAVIAQYCNRTAQLRCRSSRPSLHQLVRVARPSLQQRHVDLATATLDETRSLLAKELRSLPPGQRSRVLLSMPLSLAEKRTLRRELNGQRGSPRDGAWCGVSCSPCGRCKYHIILGCRGLWYGLLSLLSAARPWHRALKQIGSRFGSSVLSYFLFLKTLLMFNVFLFLLLLVFVVAPQAAYPPAPASRRPFTGLDVLTGAGYFTRSLLYYGYYSNDTLNEPCAARPNCSAAAPAHPYNMPLAYVFTVGVSFFLTCVLLVYCLSRSFGESYRLGGPARDLGIKVFYAWDFKVVQRHWVKLQSENICTQLKELLAEQQSRSRPRSCCWQLEHVAVRLLAWGLCLGTVLGWVVAVRFFSEHMHAVQQDALARAVSEWQQEAILLVLPLVVSFINAAMPHIYNLLATWERWDSPVLEVYVAICRSLLLKMVVLGLLCYQWLSREVVCASEACWETCVGQDLYRFMVMDFIFTLLNTVFGELVWRLVLEKRLKRRRRPEFDIARNVLELIYGQTLTWLGVLFSPLLPAVQIVKLLLLFYIKKTSLVQNCQSPSKPWQASHMSTVFITLLCFPSFLGAAIFLFYTIWSVKPSETCGPFQGMETIYESGKTWVHLLEKSSPNVTWFTWIHLYLVENTALLFLTSGGLLAMIYFNIQVMKGHRIIINLLKEQIFKEAEDKRFLIQKLHSIYEQRERYS
ncbi:transmembrane channel-like protein 6 [Rhea pennata]|uniref:transmembrane channel-like protein 6 n=1 Tax=Rhea pennata TaxID=8795 RepID=UPI002E26BA38